MEWNGDGESTRSGDSGGSRGTRGSRDGGTSIRSLDQHPRLSQNPHARMSRNPSDRSNGCDLGETGSNGNPLLHGYQRWNDRNDDIEQKGRFVQMVPLMREVNNKTQTTIYGSKDQLHCKKIKLIVNDSF